MRPGEPHRREIKTTKSLSASVIKRCPLPRSIFPGVDDIEGGARGARQLDERAREYAIPASISPMRRLTGRSLFFLFQVSTRCLTTFPVPALEDRAVRGFAPLAGSFLGAPWPGHRDQLKAND